MTLARWVKRRFGVQGHAVGPEWLWAVQWTLGVLGIAWALLLGVFIACGGAERMTGELYQKLIAEFDDYHVIGAAIIIGGLLGVIGLLLNLRALSIGSAGICALWNGLLAFYTIPANWTVPGGGNIVGFYALFTTVVYLLRIVLLVQDVGKGAVKLL